MASSEQAIVAQRQETIERLRGLDAAFLYLETPSQHMHVCGTMILEAQETRPSDPHEHDGAAASARAPVERVADVLLGRLASMPAFRRRLAVAPLSLTHPAWTYVPGFRPREHLRFATLPLPGSVGQLADLVGHIAATPLPRDRPLWELWAIDGMEGGRIGIVVKVHHVMLDGVAGLGVLAGLFSTEADDDTHEPRAVETDAPSALRLGASAITYLAWAPARLAHAVVHTGRSLLPLARSLAGRAASHEKAALPFGSARTSLNHALTPARAVAFGRVSLASVKRIKNAFGVTVNDVVLAGCTLSLREYLLRRGELPARPIVATVPVSEHAGGEAAGLGNRVSAMFIGLPVNLADATEVVSAVHAGAAAAKTMYASLGPSMLADWVELAPPSLFAGAARLYSRWKLAERLPPVHSVVISNVAGPPMPLYGGGARLIAAYPLGPILEGAAMNISVMSYAGSVDFGLVTCPQSVAQPWDIARGFERAIAHLEMLAEERTT